VLTSSGCKMPTSDTSYRFRVWQDAILSPDPFRDCGLEETF